MTSELTSAETAQRATTAPQIYQVFIKATPEAIWEAITRPEFTVRYFHGSRATATESRYHSLGPNDETWVDGRVAEFDPPRRLVHAWRSLYDPEAADEPESRVTYEIEPREGGYCLLTLTHDELDRSPKTARTVSGEGWMYVLSGLKTLLETGQPMRS